VKRLETIPVETIPIFGTPEAAAKFFILIFGIWAISAVVNVGMADWRGRNPVLWGIIGLIFGPFGVLVLLLRLRKKTDAEKTAESQASASVAKK